MTMNSTEVQNPRRKLDDKYYAYHMCLVCVPFLLVLQTLSLI